MEGLPILFAAVVVAVIIISAVYGFISQQRRRAELFAWCRQRNYQFDPSDFDGLDGAFPQCPCFNVGHSRRAFNRCMGMVDAREFQAFDYVYVTGSGKNRHTHRLSVVTIRSRFPLLPLLIRPETLGDKFSKILGMQDIEFESAEFNRRFIVQAADRKWAYDILHQRAMQFLLNHAGGHHIQFDLLHVVVWGEGQFAPQQFENAGAIACGLLDLVPEYVVKQQTG